jgi:hypothetical protein
MTSSLLLAGHWILGDLLCAPALAGRNPRVKCEQLRGTQAGCGAIESAHVDRQPRNYYGKACLIANKQQRTYLAVMVVLPDH